MALGCDAHVGLLLAPRYAGALRHARRRAEARGDDRILVDRSGYHARCLFRIRRGDLAPVTEGEGREDGLHLSLIHISEPTRLGMISYAVFCLKKKKKQ